MFKIRGLKCLLDKNVFHLWRFSDCCIHPQTIVGVYCIGAGPEFCEQSGIYNGLMSDDGIALLRLHMM